MKTNNPFSVQPGNHFRAQAFVWGIVVLLAAFPAFAQVTTNAYDTASDPAYTDMGAPNGLSPGGQNGGFGFDAWTVTVGGSGGAFIQNNGPSGDSFDLWNTTANNDTVAVRPFSAPLSAGQSFSIQLRLNALQNNLTTNMLALQDADGNILFAYWHVGGDNLNGWYQDGAVNVGVATNFTYAYQSFKKFTFTLNSPTNYTFSDGTSGASFTGVIANAPIAQVSLIRFNGDVTPPNGQDFQFDQLLITSAAPPTFQSVTPAPDSLSAPVNGPISLQVISGGILLNTNAVSMKVDGNNITPAVSGSGSIMNISYTPGTAFNDGSLHTVEVVVQDNNAVAYTNTWSFTTGYPALPVVLPGPFAVSNGIDKVIFTAAGEGWLGTNYNDTSSRTLYARYSMVFNDLNGETGDGGGYGGLHFFQGDTQKLIAGNAWVSLNWSLDAAGSQMDLSPVVPVTLGEWHTIVVRTDYVPGGEDNVKVWLDPDFSQTEANQPNAPLTLNADVSFDNIRLRCGNGTANAVWTNIILASTSAGVGFVAPSAPQFQSYVPAVDATAAAVNTPISVKALFGTYSISSNNVTLNVDGNDVTPTFTTTANSLAISYQPTTPFDPGSSHSVTVNLTDDNGTPYSTSWSFTADPYPVLPVSAAGPYDVGNGVDQTLWTSQNEWIGNHYNATSTNTLYARFTVVFYDLNGETGGGGGYGGLHFFQDNSEVLLVGNAWASTNWSLDAAGLQLDLSPVVPVVLGEPHTLVVKTVYVPNADDNVTVWLDPDFSKSELNQPQAPLTLSVNNSFNNVRLRCGNGTAFAEFSDITLAANATEVGFAAAVTPGVLNLQGGGTERQLSWTGEGTLQTALAITGPWTDAADQSNPQTLSTTNTAMFFRLRQ